MNIELHIDRLVLEGLPLESRHGSQLREAIERELHQLLQSHSLAANMQVVQTIRRIQAPAIQFSQSPQLQSLGQQIAQSIYDGIGGQYD